MFVRLPILALFFLLTYNEICAQIRIDSAFIIFDGVPTKSTSFYDHTSQEDTTYNSATIKNSTFDCIFLAQVLNVFGDTVVIRDTSRLPSRYSELKLVYDPTQNIASYLRLVIHDNPHWFGPSDTFTFRDVKLSTYNANRISITINKSNYVPNHTFQYIRYIEHKSSGATTHTWTRFVGLNDTSEVTLTLIGNLLLTAKSSIQTSTIPIPLYPNPTSHILTVKLSSFNENHVQYTIKNITGSTVANDKTSIENSCFSIDVRKLNLTTGVYYLNYTNNNALTQASFLYIKN